MTRRAAGSIRERSPGVWLVTVSAGNDPTTGQRRRVATTVRGSRADAERALAVALTTTRPDMAGPRNLTLEAYLRELWLPHVGQHVRRRTVDGYEGKLRLYVIPHLGGYRLEGLTPLLLDRWLVTLAEQGVGATTRKHAYTVLRQALRQAVRWRMLDSDPLAAVTAPTVGGHEPTILTIEQARQLVDAARGTRLAPIVAVTLGGGLRRSEACGLTWGDVDLDAGTVRVERGLHEAKGATFHEPPKTARSRRTVALPAWAVELLRPCRALPATPLVTAPSDPSQPWLPSEVTHAFRELSERAGVRVPLRDLRHSSATLALAAGVDVAVVSRRLGHSNLATTDRFYLRPGEDLQRAAARAVDELYDGTGTAD